LMPAPSRGRKTSHPRGPSGTRVFHARKRILGSGYRLQLYYVTLGRCSKLLIDEADRIARRTDISAAMDVIDGRQILRLLEDSVVPS